MQALKQSELAQRIGISPSYLNLIEHNKRRIGGKLLLDIAEALDVEPQALTEGAEAALLGALREAALAVGLDSAELERVETFAGRFPGWAEALASQGRRIADLERTVETLSDRMAHDPHLAGQMHELLTTAAAVRSTAEILAGEGALEREWQDRFHSNLNADSRRLADSAQALVNYLEDDGAETTDAVNPQAEVERVLARHDYRFDALEGPGADIESVVATVAPTLTSTGRFILHGVLEQMEQDADLLPITHLEAALKEQPPDPVPLARAFHVPVGTVLRRLASMPSLNAGLVVCDRSGTVIFRKTVEGFSVPQFDSCCPLWPLFGALAAPGTILYARIGQLGRGQAEFDAYATAEAQSAPAYNAPALTRGIMLLLPARAPTARTERLAVGSTCRICPRESCTARRVPSILAGESGALGF